MRARSGRIGNLRADFSQARTAPTKHSADQALAVGDPLLCRSALGREGSTGRASSRPRALLRCAVTSCLLIPAYLSKPRISCVGIGGLRDDGMQRSDWESEGGLQPGTYRADQAFCGPGAGCEAIRSYVGAPLGARALSVEPHRARGRSYVCPANARRVVALRTGRVRPLRSHEPRALSGRAAGTSWRHRSRQAGHVRRCAPAPAPAQGATGPCRASVQRSRCGR